MLNSDDLQMIRAVVRQELTGLLHPSVQRDPASAPPLPANDHETHPDQPPPDAA
ncbi:hypothetical protein [Brevundimonas vesicularis]|uniref:hypothetical protein n=1 Tax=Brevundimonas vesicularis TaxID=41276 RepID=UPI00142F3273|nr:hypothetical protein [Brevundimonas vesicularis]